MCEGMFCLNWRLGFFHYWLGGLWREGLGILYHSLLVLTPLLLHRRCVAGGLLLVELWIGWWSWCLRLGGFR